MPEVLEKLKHWCAYQERSYFDVERKAYEFNLSKEETNQVISQLISDNFLNEERFAMTFVSGKFRIKQWGKIKLRNELKKHHVNDRSIQKALNSIDNTDYEQALRYLMEKKTRTLKEKDERKRKFKLIHYLSNKGFEIDIIQDLLKEII